MLKESIELSTTLAQNHQQQLSGNNILLKRRCLFFAIAVVLGVFSCTPKLAVLKAPDSNVGSVIDTKTTEENKGEAKSIDKFDLRNIALLLPFQLDQINTASIANKDVKRAALALDFYQGFELGLEEIAKSEDSFNLDVIDTRDNALYVSKLATSDKLKNSSIVIGPVYPQEIKSFGQSFVDKAVLQVNPLAATMPKEFNLSNLVSLTPSITAHSKAVANRVAKDFSFGDVIIVYNTDNADSRQFLNGMVTEIKASKSNVSIVSVSSLEQLNDNLKLNGTNYIIAGTTDKIQLKTLIENLTNKYLESYYTFNLFGHPLWDRYDFSVYKNFSNLNPYITTESTLRPYTAAVKNFDRSYFDSFGIKPSDISYKGYDAAMYFGKLLAKYGAGNIANKLVLETYSGIFSSYKFKFNQSWGYVNESVFFKEYRGDRFQLQ